MRGRLAGVICALALAVLAAPAHADDRPWAEGVPEAEQTRAYDLFGQGNDLLEKGLYAPALDIYRQAIGHWDHPTIRYNMAVALINLQRTLEAFDNLERSLRFGAAALEPDIYKQALAYQRLLGGQIVELTIDCTLAGARISLDGNELMSCPGTRTERLLAGGHRLVGEKSGYLARKVELALSGGQRRKVAMDLMTLEQSTVSRRRWARWKPWAVIGGGAALGLAGLGFALQSRATLSSYDDAVAVLCDEMPCDIDGTDPDVPDLPDNVRDAYGRGRRQGKIGIGLLIAGGAAAGTGAVLLYLNRAVTERIGYEAAPIVGTDRVGLALGRRF
jgi:hypothetical protein